MGALVGPVHVAPMMGVPFDFLTIWIIVFWSWLSCDRLGAALGATKPNFNTYLESLGTAITGWYLPRTEQKTGQCS